MQTAAAITTTKNFREKQHIHHTVYTRNSAVESTRVLGVYATNKLKWTMHTASIVKEAQQHGLVLKKLKKAFYRGTTQSVVPSATLPQKWIPQSTDVSVLMSILLFLNNIPYVAF